MLPLHMKGIYENEEYEFLQASLQRTKGRALPEVKTPIRKMDLGHGTGRERENCLKSNFSGSRNKRVQRYFPVPPPRRPKYLSIFSRATNSLVRFSFLLMLGRLALVDSDFSGRRGCLGAENDLRAPSDAFHESRSQVGHYFAS